MVRASLVALVMLTSGAPTRPPLTLDLVPRVALGPHLTVRVRAQVEPAADNRWLVLELDAVESGFYRSTAVALAGERGPRTTDWLQDVTACGTVEARATVETSTNEAAHRARSTVEVRCQ